MDQLAEVKEHLPSNASVSDLRFEASDIVIYTDSKEFFLDNSDVVKEVVSEFKKRVEVRPSSKLFKEPENAKKEVEEYVSDEAGLEDVIFQPSLGKMIVRVRRPGELIGKNGSGLDELRKRTLWAPQVERVPAIDSKIVDRARELTVEDASFRKKFLHDVGKKIRLDKSVGDEWVRIGALGGARQVGRSCWLLQTEESQVLMDCGINPSAEPGSTENYPYLNAPELDLKSLDAVVLSHAHMDHCLTPDSPVTMSDGSRKPIAEMEKGDKLKTLNWKTGEVEEGECTGKKEVPDEEVLEIKTKFNSIKASGDHKFFRVNGLKIEEVKADKLVEGDTIPKKPVERNSQKLELEEPNYRERLKITDEAREEIKQERKEKEFSQKELSERIKKGENFVYQFESEYESIYRQNLEAILKELDLSFQDFIKRNDIEVTKYPDLNKDFAQLLGYLYGDGHRDGNRLRFTDKNIECLENYQELVEKLFNHKPEIRRHTDREKNAYQLEVNNIGIVRFFEKNFEGIFARSTDGKIPKKIVNGSSEAVEGFLKGIFDAEGDVVSQIRIAQNNEEVRKQIQNLLSSVGVEASISGRRVNISRQDSIKNFVDIVGADHPEKKEKIENLGKISGRSQELMPVTSSDFEKILEDTGMIGSISGSPDYTDLPSCLMDLYRRDSDSRCTRKTVEKIAEFLEKRSARLDQLEIDEISQSRKSLSLTREDVADSAGTKTSQLQVIEDTGYNAENYIEVKESLEERREQYLENTRNYLEKIQNLLEIDVQWREIKSIQRKSNDYGYLVDIRVDPHHNFIANDQVVHNCGMIPFLYKMGYDGPLYCTEPTRDMMIMLTLDYIKIAHNENQTAPYDSSDIKKAVQRTITPSYGEVTDITPDMRLTLRNSGHIIGSSLVHIHIGEGLHNVLYTGDYNYDQSEMLRPADTNFKRVETMITESTYGGKGDKQQPREEAQKQFLSKIKQTLSKGGKVVVPVFAVGRSQEILGLLADELDRDYFDYTVYVDGMIKDANALHTAYPEFLSKNVQRKILDDQDSPFTKDQLYAVGSHDERQKAIDEGPCVILATSGMMTGGPVMSYFRELAEDEKNAMIFVGYQASGTLGNKIQQGRSKVDVGGQKVNVNLDVSTVSGFSAHSDRQQIINFCKNLRSSPNKVLTNHGEESKCFSLASTLHKVLHIDTSAPQNLEIDRLN